MKQNNKDSVKDHCYISGRYRGAVHLSCNLKLKINPEKLPIPVAFHNLKGYDSHHLVYAIDVKVEGRG